MDDKTKEEMTHMIDVLTGRTSYGPDSLLSTGDVALLLSVSEATVKRWSDEGKFPSIRTPGGHRKVRLEDLARYSAEKVTS